MNWLNGGRKWRGFLILVFIFVVFVVAGYIKSEAVIRDIFIYLFGLLGIGTVAESWVTGKGGDSEQKQP